MKTRISLPFVLLMCSILIMGLICGPGTTTAVAPTGGGSNTNPIPTSNNGGSLNIRAGAVNNIQDVQKATIQIESDGTFVDPQEGVVVNGAGRGSGFIIDPSGIAVTNNHVVTGAALIKVWVNGETNPRNARILGVSECSDLAVIKIDGSGFSYLNWYNQTPTVGLEVYTAGFPLGLPEYSLTKGIISKLHADGQTSWASLDHVLAHDATINPGNSGGPLVTSDGQVVGINYASIKSADQYFAIDSSNATPIVDQLKTGVDIDSIGINGTAFVSNDGSISGIWISSVKSGSPADKAGMKGGDILLQMEGLVLAKDGTMKDYCSILRTHKPTDTLSINVFRYSTSKFLAGELNGPALAVSGSPSSGQTSPTQGGSLVSGDLIYSSDFSDTDVWKMYTKNATSLYTVQSRTIGLYINIPAANDWVALYHDLGSTDNRDVQIESDVELIGGTNYTYFDLICRSSNSGEYEFILDAGGFWQIGKLIGSNYTRLAGGGSSAINVAKSKNHLTAICQGNTLTMLINNTVVGAATDDTLTDGEVGVQLETFDNPVSQAYFHNFDVFVP